MFGRVLSRHAQSTEGMFSTTLVVAAMTERDVKGPEKEFFQHPKSVNGTRFDGKTIRVEAKEGMA